MGNYAYCHYCGEAMGEPTVSQVLEVYGDSWDCGCCGKENEPAKTVNDVIFELHERIEALENK